eukprot:TRINITY_DN4574_c1_g4_i1.p1 TRINITY_DN4574_c1_g4~~TRINITY_DN4574_c1_g4_i1.p1  ORF type:complete len:380 (+),score=117.25 TRINITY_DN4574_c1_g4_i1:46-1185(+)
MNNMEGAFDTLGAVVSTAVLLCVVYRMKFIAALGQMGSVQERTMPWAQLTRKSSGDGDALAKALERSVLEQDKFVFTFGVMNFGISAYLLGGWPQYYYLWHTPKAVFYILHRLVTFRAQGMHYYLFDFCYWVNLLSLIYIWGAPGNALLFEILFVAANGPLAWSVCAFQNSMIFHSAPHMTSVFIHTSPMVLTYALRWFPNAGGFAVCVHPDPAAPADGTPACLAPNGYFTDAALQVWSAVAYFYVWWAVLYYVWIYIIRAQRIKDRGYETLFDYVTKATPLKALSRVTANVAVQRILYLAIHISFGGATMLLAALFQWHSWWAHLAFTAAIFSASCWNASGYYFTVFLRRYEESVQKRVDSRLTPSEPALEPRRPHAS